MANTSRISGFRPAYHAQGGGKVQVRKYFIPSSDATAVYPGDVVKLAGSADTDAIAPTVTLAAAGDAVVGIVAHFAPDPTNLNVDGQKRAASTNRYVYVYDDPYQVFEAEASNGTLAAVDVGLNFNHATGTPVSSTSNSGAYIDAATKATTATLTFKLMSFSSRVDNEVAAAAKVYVMINNHQMRGTGILGV